MEAGRNAFALLPRKWIELTGAIGIQSKSGRYGGTFAHVDIAIEFASWISPEFKFISSRIISGLKLMKDIDRRRNGMRSANRRK